jgi:hypothetical protein
MMTNDDEEEGFVWECGAFESEEEHMEYLKRIAPRRELVCPITQELLRDPVAAEDGHTYERTAILRWFATGHTRSPVLNSLLSGRRLISNLALQGMAQAHADQLGSELLQRCRHIFQTNHHENDAPPKSAATIEASSSMSTRVPDGGQRIRGLLDHGADPNIKCLVTGNTALLFLIQAGELHLAQHVLNHGYGASVLVTNQNGKTPLHAAEACFSTCTSVEPKLQWSAFLQEIRKSQQAEHDTQERRTQERQRVNQEYVPFHSLHHSICIRYFLNFKLPCFTDTFQSTHVCHYIMTHVLCIVLKKC